VTALLLMRLGGDVVGRCDAACYDAKHDPCVCVCASTNHGVGLEQAMVNTREMAKEWAARARATGRPIDTYELDVMTQHEPLF
jgi:hypothetical protein